MHRAVTRFPPSPRPTAPAHSRPGPAQGIPSETTGHTACKRTPRASILAASRLLCLGLWCAFAPPLTAAPDPALDSIRKVRSLPAGEAVKRIPVTLEATVLYHDPAKQEFFLDDGTATCYANTTASFPQFPPGTRLAIEGETVHIGLFPHFQIRTAHAIGSAPMPEPYEPPIRELLLPELDSKRVRFPAVVTGVEQKGLGYTLVLQVAGYTFKADLPPVENADLRAAALMQKPVLVTGFAGTVFNDDMQMTGRHFFIGSFDDLRPATTQLDEQSARMVSIHQLLDARGSPDEIVRVEGVITQHHSSGFFIADSSAATLVHAAPPSRMAVGTVVEVVGYASIAPYRPILRAMSVRAKGEKQPLQTRSLPSDAQGLEAVKWTAYHNQRVRHKAELLELHRMPDSIILQCRSANRVFDAVLDRRNLPAASLPFKPGDYLQFTGICELTTSRPIPRHDWIEGFRILLPGVESVTVLRKAPWWTHDKLIAALGLTAATALLAFTAAALLKRQVSRQLRIISGKIRQESVSNERDRMARELHDTLEQNLTGLSLLIDGIDAAAVERPGTLGRRVAVLRHMLRHTRSEARKSVWDLRSHILDAEELAAALQELETLPAGPHCTLSVRLRRPLPDFPPASAYHLLRVAQEALTNAIKHAKAREISLTLEPSPNPGFWHMLVEDDGKGFDPQEPVDDELPHFGVIGMNERAAKIGGHLKIESRPGHGCRVILTLAAHPPDTA